MPKHPLLLQTQRYTKTVAFILSSGEVMLSCSYCAKEGLVYIAITAPSSHQPSSYSECTSLNIYSSYNVHSVLVVKCIFLYLILSSSQFLSKDTLYHAALLALICTL